MNDYDISTILKSGNMEISGEFLWGSNYTFLAKVAFPAGELAGVYKPARGERPLWDFPSASLAKREVAAYVVSKEIGWNLVPPTVFREDAPLGAGSLQLFIDHDPEYHYFSLTPDDRQKLRPVVLFDFLINNADRKGGHVLRDADGYLWFIDHGLSFHVLEKLRTVIWDFVGEPIPEDLCEDINRFRIRLSSANEEDNVLVDRLREYLGSGEIRALIRRADHLVKNAKFPEPDPHRRHYPWPQL